MFFAAWEIEVPTLKACEKEIRDEGALKCGKWSDGCGGVCSDIKEAAKRRQDYYRSLRKAWKF